MVGLTAKAAVERFTPGGTIRPHVRGHLDHLEVFAQQIADARDKGDPDGAKRIFERNAKPILIRLDTYAERTGAGYAGSNVALARWHLGAMAGVDIDNGHGVVQHHSWARQALRGARGVCGFNLDSADASGSAGD